MESNGYIVIDFETKRGYVIRDAKVVAKMVGISTTTFWRRMSEGGVMENKRWFIRKGYEYVKSNRGSF